MINILIRKKHYTGKISEKPLYIMLLPSFAILVIYHYLPMYGLVMAFQDFKPAFGLFGKQVWVGLENFRFFMQMEDFKTVLFNTVFIAFLKIIVGMIVPVTVALLLNEMGNKMMKRTIQTFIYLPHFLSWVILGGVFVTILSPGSGLVNRILGVVGIQPIFFLGDNHWFRFTMIVTDSWKNFGWGTIVYLAALAGVDQNIYQSASIDGANRLQQVIHITIPSISFVWVMLMVMSMGNILNAGFDQIFNLYGPIVYKTGDIIDTFVYRVGLVQARYSLGTAVGMFKGVINMVLVYMSYFLAYRLTGRRIF